VSRPEAELAVVHLVRASNGPSPFVALLDSYRRHPAGVPHEFVLVFKGFSSCEEIEPYERLARDLPVRALMVDDRGYDLGAYFTAARKLPHDRFCFLNSFSVLVADRWLELLSEAIDEPRVGLAGASGSWASVASRVHWELWRRGAYAGIFDDGQAFPERLLETFADFDRPAGPSWRTHKFWTLMRILTSYHRFPAHHLRTNGFVIDRETMFRLHAPRPRDKIDAHLLECGRRSITRQIERMHMQVVVAGRNGNRHRPLDWARSRTFWQGDQENLLIADNQTENYKRAEPDVRLALSRWAWGAEADSRAAGG
jgi:hypothetical protein